MYHPRYDRSQERRMHRPQTGTLVRMLRGTLLVLTVVFWVAAASFVVLLVVPSLVGVDRAGLHLLSGITYLVVVLSSGAIAWIEFRGNPTQDAESGEWTNRMLFYGLVFALTFFMGFYYLPALYFAP